MQIAYQHLLAAASITMLGVATPVWSLPAVQGNPSALVLPEPTGAGATPLAPVRRSRTEMRDAFTLAFVDADARRVIDAVLGSMLGVDYSIDPKVSGNLTLRTAQPVTRDALLPMLEQSLGAIDAVLLRNGESYRIVPRSTARTKAPFVASGSSSTPGFATEVVTLRNASPKEIGRLLEQFLGKDVVAGVDASYNQVMIAGSADERRAARDLIARFDVDALAHMNFRMFRLENVDPETISREFDRIFKPPFDVIGSRVRIVPLARLHSILAIAVDQADLGRIEPWIRRLDTGASGRRKLYSYAVQNGRARDLASSLQRVLGSGGDQGSSDTSTRNSASTGGLGASGSAGSGLSSSGTTGVSGMTQSSSLSPAGSPSDVIGAQTPLPGSGTPLVQPGPGGGLRIVPNDDTNTLLIYADGEEYDLVREALDKIDRMVPQVLIEATLAEVTLTKDLSAGVDWRAMTGNSVFGVSNNAAGTVAPTFPGLAYNYVSSTAQAVLSTLQSKTRVRVLSAPRLIVLNNQTATLQVGDQVPIVTQQAQSVAAAGAPIVNTIELHDTGVILKVTPRVNDAGTIMLDIAQEVSDVTQTTTSGINSPTIQQRRIATSVATRSGQMVALGGLIRDSTTRSKQGIPFLSQIPVLGAAFGRQVDSHQQTELIILLTPTIMRTSEEVRGIVDELIDGLDSTKPLVMRARESEVGARHAAPPR